jgi:hypothetical protein
MEKAMVSVMNSFTTIYQNPNYFGTQKNIISDPTRTVSRATAGGIYSLTNGILAREILNSYFDESISRSIVSAYSLSGFADDSYI